MYYELFKLYIKVAYLNLHLSPCLPCLFSCFFLVCRPPCLAWLEEAALLPLEASEQPWWERASPRLEPSEQHPGRRNTHKKVTTQWINIPQNLNVWPGAYAGWVLGGFKHPLLSRKKKIFFVVVVVAWLLVKGCWYMYKEIPTPCSMDN